MTAILGACLVLFQSPGGAEAPPKAPEVAERLVAGACAWIDQRPDASLETLRASFSDEMRAALSAQALERTLAGLRAPGDARAQVIDFHVSGVQRTWTYLLEQERARWVTLVTLDAQERVSGWWIRLAPVLRSRAELLELTHALDGDVGFAAELLDAQGKRLDSVEVERGRQFLPLGSIFKLYVLAELARSVDAGERALDDELTIEERWKSLPSGEMQALPAGTQVELAQAAREMIRVSDNTATDHLLHLLGREKVEAGLAHCFLSEPARMQPFLSTLEMFAAKSLTRAQNQRVFGCAKLDDAALAWRDSSVEQRRGWLAELDRLIGEGEPPELRKTFGARYGLTSFGAKHHVEIEWHARPRDVCALVAAAQRGELHSPGASRIFLDFYAAGQPLYPMPGVVAHGYKGGSETSVFALSTRVVLADGRSVVACLLRCGFPAADTKVPDQSIGLLLDWLQNVIDGDALGRAREAKSGEPAER